MTNSQNLGRAELSAKFSAFIDPAYVIDDLETQRPYECDGLTIYSEMPLLVVLPDSVEQVIEVLRICHQYQVPVVARGAGTGLSGGATPNADGVLLSLAKFDRILGIDPLARTATVQPGVRNQEISEAVAPYGLFYGPDPSSQIACTIGGNVAENSGGIHCLKYGLTVHNVLRLEVLTAEGERLVIGSHGLDSAGFDLLALMNGSEGLLGIVTEITVKLLPRPEHSQVVMAAFDNVENAGAAVAQLISEGIVPAALEMMDSLAIKAAEKFAKAGYPTDAEALLLCELDGAKAEVAEGIDRVDALFRSLGAESTHVARSQQEKARIWKGRKSAFPAMGHISPDYYCMDGTIPRSEIAHVFKEMAKIAGRYGLRVANVFHAGDGNLHPLILFDASVPGEIEKAEQLGGEILELCVATGGCITGEHGVGIEKLRQMPVQFTDAELEQLRRIKSAFDPCGILNPGKGVPSLKRCQEYRSIDIATANVGRDR